MNPSLIRKALLITWEIYNNIPLAEKYHFLMKSQWYSRKRIREIQNQKLKRLIEHCSKNIPYYINLFKKEGINPNTINNQEKLKHIPILEKEVLKANRLSFLCQNGKIKDKLHVTSGSSGSPVAVNVSLYAEAYRIAAKYRGRSWYGLKRGDREAWIWGVRLFPSNRNRFMTFIRDDILWGYVKKLSIFDLSEKSMINYVKDLRNFSPKSLYGYTSGIAYWAKFLNEAGIDASDIGIKAVITTAEMLFPWQRDEIEKAFGCKVANEYGSAEAGIHAFECPEGVMHVSDENIILEVEPIGGQEFGRVLITELNNYSMPLLRYAIGDLAQISNEKCSCGRGLRTLNNIKGRDLDLVRLSNGKVIHAEVFDYINRAITLERKGNIRSFRVIQRNFNDFSFQIIRGKQYSEITEKYIAEKVRQFVVKDANIEFEYLSTLPLDPSGKLSYFYSELRSDI